MPMTKSTSHLFDAVQLRALLARHFMQKTADSEMTFEALRASASKEKQVLASVLIALFQRNDSIYFWLIKRPETMRTHKGQIALPGGKFEASDRDLQTTALRETEEELGFSPAKIDILGAMPRQITITKFLLTPYVGFLREDLLPTPNPREVDKAFCAKLDDIIFHSPRPHLLKGEGISRVMPSYYLENEIVWGATCRILQDFSKIIREL
jgi:8-oxo-dGTP pyrophosphatase MutT (NUDIX family)